MNLFALVVGELSDSNVSNYIPFLINSCPAKHPWHGDPFFNEWAPWSAIHWSIVATHLFNVNSRSWINGDSIQRFKISKLLVTICMSSLATKVSQTVQNPKASYLGILCATATRPTVYLLSTDFQATSQVCLPYPFPLCSFETMNALMKVEWAGYLMALMWLITSLFSSPIKNPFGSVAYAVVKSWLPKCLFLEFLDK